MAISDLLKRAGELTEEEQLALVKRVMQKQQQAPKLDDIFAKKSEIETIVASIIPNYTSKGEKGDRGEQGLQGPAGRDGSRGLNGMDGKDGRDGNDGKNGIDGKDGKDGISVVDASIALDGSLVLKLSDDSEIDCGKVIADEIINQYYSTSSSGSGGVQSIVAGTNITVDNTDPFNPIISSTGGGGTTNVGTSIDGGNATTSYIEPAIRIDFGKST